MSRKKAAAAPIKTTEPAPAAPPAPEGAAPAAEAAPAEKKTEGPKGRRKPTAAQLADEAALLGKMTPTERALHHFGLEPRHVLNSREVKQEDGTIEVRILTQGGQRVFYPRDQARELSDMEKGEAGPGAESAGIFPAKA